MQEKFLYHIWDEGHFQQELTTVSGKSLRVVYQGLYNTNRGPDFVNAYIIMDNVSLTGNIEIHLSPQDWERHNHQEDQYYNSVILHVVFDNPRSIPFTVREDGELVEILVLKPYLTQDISKLIDDKAFVYPVTKSDYCDLLSLATQERVQLILGEFGRKRFWGKVRRFNAMLTFHDFDQLLYQGIMEALGYDKNKYNMQYLASEITWAEISTWAREGLRAQDLRAILCVASGILPRSEKLLDSELVTSLIKDFETQAFYYAKHNIDWQLFRVRPQNHPIFRLLAISDFFADAAQVGLLKTIIGLYGNESKPFFASFSDCLLSSSKASKTGTPLGKSLLANIFLNIILPIAYLYMQKIGDEAGKISIIKTYREFPALSENHITKYMHTKVNNQARYKNKAHIQQGMIEIYNHYCQYHLCDQCTNEFKRMVQ